MTMKIPKNLLDKESFSVKNKYSTRVINIRFWLVLSLCVFRYWNGLVSGSYAHPPSLNQEAVPRPLRHHHHHRAGSLLRITVSRKISITFLYSIYFFLFHLIIYFVFLILPFIVCFFPSLVFCSRLKKKTNLPLSVSREYRSSW